MFRTPRTKFAESTHAAAWKKLVQGESFEEATNAAMLELQMVLPEGASPMCADFYQQLVGARRYLDMLYVIAEKEQQPKIAQSKGLNYSAGV